VRIETRWHNKKLMFVTVCLDSVHVDLGLLDEEERKQLAECFREAADELYPLEQTND
jgi:hypothetical protein